MHVWVPHIQADGALFQTMCSGKPTCGEEGKKEYNLLMEKNNFYIDIIPVLV